MSYLGAIFVKRGEWTAWAVMFMGLVGCERSAAPRWVSSKEVNELPEKARVQVLVQLEKYCGTPSQPRLLGALQAQPERLRHGAELFHSQCASCHGETGDGNGPASAMMYPRPRDYRKGIFKFSSTPYGARPLRSNIERTVREGAKGTSMPSFKLWSEEDLQAVVDHVLVLTHRGELEILLALEAGSEDEIDPANVPGYVDEIKALWQRSADQVIFPISRMPKYTTETVELGRKAFATETAGCFKCHGLDGRGKTTDNVKGFQDAWGFNTRAADLTSAMFHGGGTPEDIYRRIYGGVSGTPMPSFKDKLANEPETFWHLVHYVQFISGQRRREVLEQVSRQQGSAPVAISNRTTNQAPPEATAK